MLATLLFFLYWLTANQPMPEWVDEVIKNARTKPVGIEQLQYVNTEVNKNVAYITDYESKGLLDYWATPSETAWTKKGDCEDYSTLKMYILSKISREYKMSVEIVREKINPDTPILHAMLKINDQYYLDNFDSNVLNISYINTIFSPVDSISSKIIVGY